MSTFRRQLMALGCSITLCAGNAAAQQALLATDGPINPRLQTIDPATGIVTSSVPITGTQALFGGLTRDGSALYSIDGYNDGISDRTFQINSLSGAGIIVGNTGLNWNFRCVEIHPITGTLYATTDNDLYTLDKTTGVALSIAPIAGATLDQLTAFAIDSTGTAVGIDIGGTGLFRLDLTTGVATHLGDLNLGTFVQDLAFDGTNQLWAVLALGDVYVIDVTSLATSLQFNAGSLAGIAFSGCAAPTSYCTVGTSAAGCTPALTFSGAPNSTASSGFTLACNNVDANRAGLFFYGVAHPSFTPTQWGSGGTSFKCVANPVQRMGVMDSGGSTGCTGAYSQDWNAFMASHPSALGNPRMLGSSFDVQLWMRDPPSPKSTLLSNAERFVLCL